MAQRGTVNRSLQIGSRTFLVQDTVDGDIGLIVEPSGGVPAAKTGQLTTRTDNDTGVITGQSGHGIVTSDVIDVYWTTGGGGARYGMTATVSGTAITVDGGTGDNLPTLNDAVTLMKPQVEAFLLNGANCKGLYVKSPVKGRIVIRDEADGAVSTHVFAAGDPADIFVDGDGSTNPLASESTVTSVTFSHSDSSGAAAQLVAALVT